MDSHDVLRLNAVKTGKHGHVISTNWFSGP